MKGDIYMVKLSRDFFADNEVLFMGYSSRRPAFSNSIYKAFTDAGVKVFPINSKQNGKYDVKVYNDISELKKVPSAAYILLNTENARKAVKQIKGSGVKRILFQPGKTADKEILDECAAAGIETAVGCPMMLFGSGLHRLHAFFTGVKR